MNRHSHTMLIDEYDNVVYEVTSEDLKSSLNYYMNWIFTMHSISGSDREGLEDFIREEIDSNSSPVVYYERNYLRYAWVTCEGCTLPSMN